MASERQKRLPSVHSCLTRLYAKAKETSVSVVDLLKQAVAKIEEQEQQIRDRALRGVMVPPKLVNKHPARLPVH